MNLSADEQKIVPSPEDLNKLAPNNRRDVHNEEGEWPGLGKYRSHILVNVIFAYTSSAIHLMR